MNDEPAHPSDTSGSFVIYLAWSDKTVTVGPEATALSALLAAGAPVEPGCGTGGCGMCATTYVEGDIEHKDACLSSSEREHLFCPCVSRARGRLVVAL